MGANRFAFKALLILTLTTLSGCGFSPMYGTSGVANGLQYIRVETGQERFDYLLQEALYDQLGSRGLAGLYTLRTETDISSLGLGVGADAIAARFAVRLSVQYELFVDGQSDAVMSGHASGEASYDVSSSVYGSLSAERDAQERAAQMAAERIIVQLARAFQDQDTW